MVGLLILFAVLAAFGRQEARDKISDRALADALFTNGSLLHLKIELPASNVTALAKTPHKYVYGTLREGEAVYTDVAIHLKGSFGSFRPIHDQPGFTLNFSAFESSSNFHGLKKFHLNNCVQDPTYLSDWLCNVMFREAGVPAPLCAHALVELNGRKLGLYVLMESNDRDFLARYFKNTKGNLYGQPHNGDITDALERMEGKGPLDRADLKALTAACREPNATKRWEALQKNLDVDRFLSFMAMEVMMCDWDGYTAARHNFRVYQDLDTGRMVFLPHDKDQVLGWPPGRVSVDQSFVPSPAGLVAQVVMNTGQGPRLYRQRCSFLFTNVFNTATLTSRVDWMVAKLLPGLQAYDANFARYFVSQADGLKWRIINRARALAKQLDVPPPAPPVAVQKPAAPPVILQKPPVVQATAKPPPQPAVPANAPPKVIAADASKAQWVPVKAQNASRLEKVQLEERPALYIKSEQANCVAAWRAEVVLRPGKYRFSGRAKARGLAAQNMQLGTGGGLRISGINRKNQISGDREWTLLEEDFNVPEDKPVRLLCELRANKGEIWFDLQSLKVERIQ